MLNGERKGPMANIIHQVQDDDMVFTLDTVTRKLVNSGSKKKTIPQYSHNSERLTFEFPRYIEGHDMSECNAIQIHYNNIEVKTKNESKDVYECNDIAVEDNKITFSWLISKKATTYEGSLNFIVILKCVADGELNYAYPTEIYDKIRVTRGLDNGEAVDEAFSDILASWKKEIIAELIGDINAAVESKVSEHNDSDTAHQDIRDLISSMADGMFSIELIWENANPNSEMWYGSMDAGKGHDYYDSYYIVSCHKPSASRKEITGTHFYHHDSDNVSARTYRHTGGATFEYGERSWYAVLYDDGLYAGLEYGIVGLTTVNIATGTVSTDSENEAAKCAIPLKIYGLKGV